MIFKIANQELLELNGFAEKEYPKYTAQLINLANQNAQATRPRAVGQLSELFPEFQNTADDITPENWDKWYREKNPDAIPAAVNKIMRQLENLKTAIVQIDRSMVERWVTDLVIAKTYAGLSVQNAILKKLAEIRKQKFIRSTPEQEKIGIDGFVGSDAYSVKPASYRGMSRLPESIQVKMIYYDKGKNGLSVEVED